MMLSSTHGSSVLASFATLPPITTAVEYVRHTQDCLRFGKDRVLGTRIGQLYQVACQSQVLHLVLSNWHLCRSIPPNAVSIHNTRTTIATMALAIAWHCAEQHCTYLYNRMSADMRIGYESMPVLGEPCSAFSCTRNITTHEPRSINPTH
jgi:hypothetical protein